MSVLPFAPRSRARFAPALAALVLAFAAPAAAQTPPAPSPMLAPGTAGAAPEAPGGSGLAPEPTPTAVPTAAPAEDPGTSRSMAFGAGAGECRDTVPGGPMLALAYAVALLIMGAYVVIMARKSARLEAALTALEDELGRRRDAADRS
jgi:hypothetical protein